MLSELLLLLERFINIKKNIVILIKGLSPYLNIDTNYLQSSPEYLFDQEAKRGKEWDSILTFFSSNSYKL